MWLLPASLRYLVRGLQLKYSGAFGFLPFHVV